jgi:hypothetical protein
LPSGPRILRNARERFVEESDQVIAFVDNSESHSGVDGVAITAAGTVGRNNYQERAKRLSWAEIAHLKMVADRDEDEVRLGDRYVVDLSGSHVEAPDLAKLFREAARGLGGPQDRPY